MTRDLGRVASGQAVRRATCWAGGVAVLLLLAATPAAALQQAVRPVTTTAVPTVAAPAATSTAAPKTYAECLRSYAGRTNATAVCQRLFPNAASTATPSTTTAPTGATTTTPTQTPTSTPASTSQPVDVTPQLNKLLDAWKNRPKPPARTPTDPLAVIPDIQAACADYVSAPERWRRCAADAWRTAGLRGQPPLVLQNPPVVAPPPVAQTPPVQPPIVQSKPPIQTPPPLTPETVQPEPVVPAPVAAPEPPPTAIVPPPAVVPPPPTPPATPIWFWLAALVAAAVAGFGVAKLLNRSRAPSSRLSKVAPAPCPEVALVADPGVVVLTPDGPPRAGMAVSLHVERATGDEAVSLDYPKLETAP